MDSLCEAVDDLHHQNQNYFSSYVLLGKVQYGDFSADDRQTKPIALPLGHALAGKNSLSPPHKQSISPCLHYPTTAVTQWSYERASCEDQ